MIEKCRTCGEESVIKVANNNDLDFYSCCNEKCDNYAELLVETNGGLEDVSDMIKTYQQIVEEVTNEKNKIQRDNL